MNILLINASPKGARSNTLHLAHAFIDGIKAAVAEVPCIEETAVNSLDIKPCCGCFSCWKNTPGKCIIRDDMQGVIAKLLWADIIIYSFPLYYFSVPGELKNLFDRTLPMNLPFMAENEAHTGSHQSRYDMSGKRTVVISTCGFYTANGNYDGVISMFDHLCGKGNYTSVFCGQGELFSYPELSQRTGEYLKSVEKAGTEFINGKIQNDTIKSLEELLFPKEIFETMADASWGIDSLSGEKNSEALVFTKQMAALYNKESYNGEAFVFEINYTDIGEIYFLTLTEKSCTVSENIKQKPNTVIETPFKVWKSIAAGEIRGDEALMKHMYTVSGDFELMLKWDKYFGEVTKKKVPRNKTNMLIMLLPFIAFWTAASINGFWGSIVSVLVSALVPLIFYKAKKTFYDFLSTAAVCAFSCLLFMGADLRLTLCASYFLFGAMWFVSGFFKIPLTAHYSMNGYGGEDALKNPIFIKTNRILTFMWGILYIATSLFTYFIMGTELSSLMALLNSVLPFLMGLFTAWFQKVYPKMVANGDA